MSTHSHLHRSPNEWFLLQLAESKIAVPTLPLSNLQKLEIGFFIDHKMWKVLALCQIFSCFRSLFFRSSFIFCSPQTDLCHRLDQNLKPKLYGTKSWCHCLLLFHFFTPKKTIFRKYFFFLTDILLSFLILLNLCDSWFLWSIVYQDLWSLGIFWSCLNLESQFKGWLLVPWDCPSKYHPYQENSCVETFHSCIFKLWVWWRVCWGYQ